MEPTTAPSAPAQPATPDPGPAPSAPSAPARIDTGAYLRDRNQQDTERKDGKAAPTADAPAASTEPPAPAPDRTVSKRQQQINDYERTVASLRSELDALKAGRSAPRQAEAPAPAATEKPVTQAEYKRYLALADAPKLDDFDSISEHTAAMALFIADKRWAEHSETARTQAESQALTESQRQRADGFAGRMKEASTADPEFWNAVSPDVANLRPLSDLRQGEPAGPLNLVAEELLTSPVAPTLMRELSKPGALARLEAGPDSLKTLPPAQRAQEHARWIVREIGKLEARAADAQPAPAATPKLISDNPPPPTRVGSKTSVPDDPVEAALKRKNTGDFLEARRQQDLAKLGRR